MSGLRVIQPRNEIRRSRSTRWRAAVLIAVHVVIAAHITLWLVNGRTLTPVEPSEAAALAVSGVINAGLVFFAITILLTGVFGRFFCGWACHLVALQDLSRALLERIGHRPKPLRSRLLGWVPMIAFVYAFLWPAIYRLAAGRAMPEIRTELTTTEFWATFPGWIVGILTFLVCGYLSVYFLGAKGFCTYACPYGAIFGVAERLAPLRIRVTDACEGCGHCTAVCTSNVRVHEEVRDFGMVVDSGCMKCLDCVSVCPNDALYYGAGSLPFAAKKRAEGRRMTKFPLSWAEEGVAAVAFAGGFFTFRGLYGQVPFLMALGLAGVLAALVLISFQVVTKPNWRFKSWILTRGRSVQRPGIVFLAGVSLLLAFWAHSGVVRYYTYKGDAGYRSARAWASVVMDFGSPMPRLGAVEVKHIYRGFSAFEKVRELGLIDSLGLDAKMAWMALLLDRGRELEEHASIAIARDELKAEMHQLLARHAFEGGDFAGAARELELAVLDDANSLSARMSLGIALAKSGALVAAKSVFENAILEFGASSILAYNVGLVAAFSGRPGEAIEHFAIAVELDPEHLPARENLAGMLATVGRFEESVAHYAVAIEQSPRDPQTRILYARVLSALGRRGRAAEQVSVALQLAPGLHETLELDSELYELQELQPEMGNL